MKQEEEEAADQGGQQRCQAGSSLPPTSVAQIPLTAGQPKCQATQLIHHFPLANCWGGTALHYQFLTPPYRWHHRERMEIEQ